MNQVIRHLAIFLIFLCPAFAKDQLIIHKKAPIGLEKPSQAKPKKEAVAKQTPHGGIEYCYENKGFIIYSKNLLGEGYTLSQSKPTGHESTKAPELTIASKSNISLGASLKDVAKKIGLKNIKEKQTIIWHSQEMMNGNQFDRQTFVEFKFKNDQLVFLNVFTTLTN